MVWYYRNPLTLLLEIRRIDAEALLVVLLASGPVRKRLRYRFRGYGSQLSIDYSPEQRHRGGGEEELVQVDVDRVHVLDALVVPAMGYGRLP